MEELAKMSAEEIAYDLASYDADCERLPIEILRAGVQAWLHPQPADSLLSDEELREMWRSVYAPHAELNGPLIRFGNLCAQRAVALSRKSADAVDPHADSTGNPSTRV
jgi:hypothetical protein